MFVLQCLLYKDNTTPLISVFCSLFLSTAMKKVASCSVSLLATINGITEIID